MPRFDLLGPLPAERSTTVLEASAGTGKTFALAGLVTRYIADGAATLDQMLLITFGRAASQELRERVRRQLVDAVVAFDDPSTVGDNQVLAYLLDGPQRDERKQRLRDALAAFDAATIATTHQFCQLVLKSLGVAGDTDAGVTLAEDLDELVTEIVDDLYLAHFGQERDEPVLTYKDALRLAREVVKNPSTELRPLNPSPDSRAAVCLDFAKGVLAELETRKRQQGLLSYDDLLIRLADALDAHDSPARVRMHHRWPIVMVDEFQDTDPVQWQVLDRAFSGRSTVILIGDPKQAIYAFRGGDIVTYLQAAETAGDKQTLGTNWRSDGALVDRLQVVLRGAELGDPAIKVHDVEAHHQGHRLSGAPHNDPFRLRVVRRETLGRSGFANLPIDELREHISADLAADIGALLAGGVTYDGHPLQARHIAVIVETHKDARCCHRALADAGHSVRVHRRLRRVHVRRRRRLVVAAGGVRPAAPPRRGARRRGDDVLRRDRGNPCGGRRCADRSHRGDVARVGGARARARSRGDLRGRAAERHERPRAVVAGRRAAHDRPCAHDAAAAGDRAPRAPRTCPRCGIGCVSNAKNGAGHPNAADASTATPPQCRS